MSITTARITEIAENAISEATNEQKAAIEAAITTGVQESLNLSYQDVATIRVGDPTDVMIPNDGGEVISRVSITEARVKELAEAAAPVGATLFVITQIHSAILQAINEALSWSFSDSEVDLSENAGSNVVQATNALKTVAPTVMVSDGPAPKLVLTQSAEVAFTEMVGVDDGSNAITLLSAAVITDLDGVPPKNAKVTITNTKTGDQLLFTDTAKIGGATETVSNNLVLTLTKKAGQTPTEADYEAALATIKFNNTSDTPDTTARVISFVITDANDNASAAKTVSVTVAASADA
jgi:hypothetical protein